MSRKKKAAVPAADNHTEHTANTANLPSFKAAVRSLVAFSIKDDAAWSFSSYRFAHEGTLAHSKLQTINREAGDYASEVYLSHSFETKDCILEVSGRADGVWHLKDKVIVQEIKTSATPLSEIGENFSEAHWAQGKCYALLLALSENLDKITVRLTYYDKDKAEEKSFDKTFSMEKLEGFFNSLLFPYAGWIMSLEKWKGVRNLSVRSLSFPYPSYRKGQKLLAYNVYKCIEDERRLFVQAPTGTGKTMGVLYPAIKALGEGKLDRLFYVTAKSTTRGIAENAYKLLAEQGMRLKMLTLTAKDKLCLNPVKNCNPEKCSFIQGYQYRAEDIVKGLLKKNDFFSRKNILETSLKHRVCPFELSLDLASGCDLIICDYNYVFDPRVYLRRFFQQKGRENYLIMVDEAHNLFGRAREMYSATIETKNLTLMAKEIRRDLPEIYRPLRDLKKALSGLESAYEKKEGDCCAKAGGVQYYTDSEPPLELLPPLEKFTLAAEDWILENDEEKTYSDRLVTLFFDLLHFKNILDLFSPVYRTLATGRRSGFKLSLLCMDPAPMLDRTMSMARSTILFSATLSPLWYFKNILGGRENDVTLRLPSPFPRENLLIFNEDRIETRFRDRSKFMESTAKTIYDWSMTHKGNVMVFFPSYKYLLDVLEIFEGFGGDFDLRCQSREMDEASRDEFLSRFEDYGDVTRIAFCVMGGVFGEGIDLSGDRLTGVIIVGPGLPQVSPETEIMRAYYDNRGKPGFTFAYTYPGFNKVLQAAGRLIRSETDRGALLLIDSRFANQEYQTLMPPEWHPVPRASQGFPMKKMLENFWRSSGI